MRRALVLLLLAGCAPTGQIVLYVDTDAPVPAAPGTPFDPSRPPALFDHLRVEVLRDGESLAQRDFSVDEARFSAGEVSVGVAPPFDDASLVARVRLFRGDRLVDGEPPASTTLDTTLRLPPVGRTARVEVSVLLRVDDVGQPMGVDAPLDPTGGLPGPSQVGTWPGAARIGCDGPAAADEVCVPGGAFLFGDPGAKITLDGSTPAAERVVVLQPFFIDRTEVTVGAFRQKWATLGGMYAPNRRDPTQTPTSVKTWCTWSDAPGSVEDLPLNCILHETAQLYCHARGRELPTEAQYELVASGRGAEQTYPWGNDEPRCGDAVYGLGGGGGVDSANPGDSSCLPSGSLGGVAAPGSAARDRATIGGGEVVDLAGNVAELALDGWSSLDDGPWAPPGVVHDPVVAVTSNFDETVARGGDFHQGPYPLRVGYRQAVPHAGAPGIGFRCARPGRATP